MTAFAFLGLMLMLVGWATHDSDENLGGAIFAIGFLLFTISTFALIWRFAP